MKHALLLSLGLAFVATASSSTAHDSISEAVDWHMPKSWFTPDQRAYIQAKCGVAPEANQRNDLNIYGSTLTCPDGRTVTDPQVRVISQDVSRRANEYVSRVMKDVDVQTAIARTASDEARKAIAEAQIDARVAEAMAKADSARNIDATVRRALADANIEQQVQQAMAQAEIGRKSAERVRDALAKSGIGDAR